MSLDRLLNAQSIAIVGASSTPKKASGMMLDFLIRSGFQGNIYPVNPRYETIADLTCYPTVDALPDGVDIAVMVLPVNAAYEALEAAARKGIPFAILTTGGYGEGMTGSEGDERRRQIQELCRQTGLKILGPNLIGLVNFRRRMPLVFADWYLRDTGQRGGVAVVTHSGSVGGLIFSSLQIDRVGVDFWIATGNEAVLETADFVDYLSDDPDIHTIACFMEGVVDGRRFMAAAELARQRGKNIVVLKAGESPQSRRSTAAHTCKKSSDGDVYKAVLGQLGVVHVESLPVLTQAVKVLTTIGRQTGVHIGLLSASGGACSVIADYLARAGLVLPVLESEVQDQLRQAIPAYGSAENPVDVTADIISRPAIIEDALSAIAIDRLIDTWIIFGRPIIERYHEQVRRFARQRGKRLIVCTGVPPAPELEEKLRDDGITVVHEPELCARALGAIHRADAATSTVARDWLAYAKRDLAETPSPGEETKALLARYGISSVEADTGVTEVVISIVQDVDFGPLLVMEDTLRDRRSIRALPLSPEDLAAAGSEVTVRAPAAVAEVAEVMLSLYEQSKTIAAVSVGLRYRSGVPTVVDATMWPLKEQAA